MTAPKPTRRSTTVTILAWMGLFSGIWAVLAGGVTLFIRPTTAGVIALLGGPVAIVASHGLRFRREWARQAFVGVMALAIVGAASRAVWPSLGISREFRDQVRGRAGLTDANLDAAAGQLRPIFIGQAIVLGLFNGLIILKLNSRKVREEFARSE